MFIFMIVRLALPGLTVALAIACGASLTLLTAVFL
jgi:hypothetical protein